MVYIILHRFLDDRATARPSCASAAGKRKSTSGVKRRTDRLEVQTTCPNLSDDSVFFLDFGRSFEIGVMGSRRSSRGWRVEALQNDRLELVRNRLERTARSSGPAEAKSFPRTLLRKTNFQTALTVAVDACSRVTMAEHGV